MKTVTFSSKTYYSCHPGLLCSKLNLMSRNVLYYPSHVNALLATTNTISTLMRYQGRYYKPGSDGKY